MKTQTVGPGQFWTLQSRVVVDIVGVTDLLTVGREKDSNTGVIQQRDYRKRRQRHTQEPMALIGWNTTYV